MNKAPRTVAGYFDAVRLLGEYLIAAELPRPPAASGVDGSHQRLTPLLPGASRGTFLRTGFKNGWTPHRQGE
jgi:hypothetical protein